MASGLRGYLAACCVLALATAVAWLFYRLGLADTNLVLAYLLGVTTIAAWTGRGPAAFASFAAVLLYNFFFTEPYYTFVVHDSQYVFTFVVMLVIGLLVSTLMARIRDQAMAVHRTVAQAETERLRSAVLSSVSHDLRTPLATIAGASSSLLESGDRLDPVARRELLSSIYEEADRLGRLVDNLLHMTRLESGQLEPRKEWNVVEDLVGSALHRLTRQLTAHEVRPLVPIDTPMVFVDGVLIELVLINLVENAAKYSPAGTAIEIAARMGEGRVLIEVADRGPGLSAGEHALAFEKFFRGAHAERGESGGAGLGLAICAAIARLHGGELAVEDRPGGGAVFRLGLPLETQPPDIKGDDIAGQGTGDRP